MHRAIIFQAALVSTAVALVYLVEGKQTRRAQDEDMYKRDADALQQRQAGVTVVEVPADDAVVGEEPTTVHELGSTKEDLRLRLGHAPHEPVLG